MERDTGMEGGERGKGGRTETDRQRQREQSGSETDQRDQNTDDHKETHRGV